MTEWTALKNEVLKRMWEDPTIPPETTAEELGVTLGAAKMQASRLHLKRPTIATVRQTPARKPKERPQDVASRIAALLGEKALPRHARDVIQDGDLMRFAGRAEWPQDALSAVGEACHRWVTYVPEAHPLDPAFPSVLGLRDLAIELCGLQLHPHQLAMAAAILGSKRAVCLAGRQVGKSTVLSALAVHACVTRANFRCIVAAGADRQAQVVAKRSMALLAQTPQLFDSVARSNLEEITFRNGSTLRVLPTEARIRGFTSDMILVDEAREVLDEEAVYSALEPQLATTDGTLGLLSTPFRSSGKLWDAWHDALWTKVAVPSADSPLVTKSYLERQRLTMSAAIYACEHEVRFLETVSQYLDSKSIAKAASNYRMILAQEEGRVYSLGVDPAVTRDAAVWLVASRGPDARVRVDHIRAYHDVALQDQRPYVGYLDSVYRLSHITPERAGLGIDLAESLRRDYPDRCIPVTPTSEQKGLVFENMKSMFERGEVDVPTDPPNLISELRSLEFEVTKAGHLRIGAPSGMNDDHACALAYALWPFRPVPAGVSDETIAAFYQLWG